MAKTNKKAVKKAKSKAKPAKKKTIKKPVKKAVKKVVKKVKKPIKKVVKKAAKKAVKKPVKKVVKPKVTAPKKVEPIKGERVGVVENYLSHLEVAVVKLTGTLSIGDNIVIQNPSRTRTVNQKVESMQIDKIVVLKADRGADIGLKVKSPVRQGDIIYKL